MLCRGGVVCNVVILRVLNWLACMVSKAGVYHEIHDCQVVRLDGFPVPRAGMELPRTEADVTGLW